MRSRRSSLALLAFAQLIISLDINIVFVALPEIGSGLHFSQQSLQWVVSAYTVFCGGFLLLGGRAADLLGQRRIFMAALALYAASSLAGGLASTPGIIIASRAAQGIGGAFLFPATLSLINRLFQEGPERNRALAIWGGAGASGLTIGALAGGLLTGAFGWPSVFFVNVVLAAIAFCAAPVVIPRDTGRPHHHRFDLPGAVLVTLAATALVYALVQGPETGWGHGDIVCAIAVALVGFVAFALVEARSAEPLMPRHIFRNGHLGAGATITFIYMGTFGALPFFVTDILQNVLRFSALQTGLGFLVPSVAIATGTQLGERLTTRLGVRVTLLAGLTTGSIGTLLLVPDLAIRHGYAGLMPGLLVSGVGQGITWTAMWVAAASGVDHDDQGVASGIASTTLNVGNAVGLAILVAIAAFGTDTGAGPADMAAIRHGSETAFLSAAAGMLLGLLVALRLPRPETAS